MMDLIAKLKKNREQQVTVGSYNFTIRRPTDLEVAGLRSVQLREGDVMERFVIDWDLIEADIDPNGSEAFVPFSTELFMEWIADQEPIWGPLTKAILEAYEAHRKAQEESLGKLEAG